jgi:nucleotidyltransferase/DNA polymerase involved in DNA repair
MSEIALVDCNNFFVSCEQLMDPKLQNKAVCVLSNNNGCIIARSKEAKQMGIPMGYPLFKAKKEFKNVIYISRNFKLYHDLSNRVIMKLLSYTPDVEQYSIDEAFLDLTGLKKLYRCSYEDILRKIKKEIETEIGIPVSIGLAPTKTLAKLACEKAKKIDALEGICRIRQKDINEILKMTSIDEIWGIGKNTSALFRKYGLYKCSEIVKQNDFWLKKIWGKRGLELKMELIGESAYPVNNQIEPPKSIQKTSAFSSFTQDERFIKDSLHYHSHQICAKLRHLGLQTEIVFVMLRTKDFRVFAEKMILPEPTDSEFLINQYVDKLFNKIFDKNIIYRASGVYVEKLTEKATSQLFLFSDEKTEKAKKLSELWDNIEKKYGKNTFSIGTMQNPQNENEIQEQIF